MLGDGGRSDVGGSCGRREVALAGLNAAVRRPGPVMRFPCAPSPLRLYDF